MAASGALRPCGKKGSDVVLQPWPLLGTPDQFAVLAQCAQHIDPLSIWLWLNIAHLPDRRPAVLFGRIWTKARFIKVELFALPRQRLLVKRPDYGSGTVKGVFIPFFKTVSALFTTHLSVLQVLFNRIDAY